MENSKFAIVLGATGGIGEEICRSLASSGWSLYLHYNKNKEKAIQLENELARTYRQATFIAVQADFSLPDGADRLAREIEDLHAIVVANGHSLLKLLSETTVEDMDLLWKVHVQNPTRFIGLVSSKLRITNPSYIVMIGSIWGNTGAAGEVMYSAVKGAQHAFVKAYAKEAAYSGIRVNAIAPGWIETRMNDEIPLEEKKEVIEEIPLLTTGRPEHIADLVSFLISGKADYITGEVLNVNGGWYI